MVLGLGFGDIWLATPWMSKVAFWVQILVIVMVIMSLMMMTRMMLIM